jgi:heat shock protein HtpX
MEPVFYKIETEIPLSFTEKLLDFTQKKYLVPQKDRFASISRKKTATGSYLSYTLLDPTGAQILTVEVKASKPLEVRVSPIVEQVSDTVVEEAKQDIVIALQIFEENARKSTLYFAWREGEEIVPEAINRGQKSLSRIFLETQVMLFILFGGLGIFLFILIAAYYPDAIWIAPLALIGVQFIFVLFSTKFIARSADWHITKANPTIHFLDYHLPLMQNGELGKVYPPEQLVAIKKEIYDEIIAKHGEIDCEEAQKIFEKHGIPSQLENLISKKVNVYELVQKIADKFGYPVPEIVVSNTMLPNAAASGPSPSHGLVLITTGLLVQLEDDEILSVLGHEFGHLKGRDPLLLYGLTSAEFLFRFYVLFTLFPFILSPFLFLVYFWLVMTLIFFIAKFFEARSDLISAIEIGQPEILAGALEKIGFQRLLYERTPSFRIQEWVGFDPHPPIYFRVSRLEKLKAPVKIKYPLIQSIKDVFSGFFASL